MFLHGIRTAFAMLRSLLRAAAVGRALETLLRPLLQILRLTRP